MARGQAEPAPPVIQVAVTPHQHDAGPTVFDEHWQTRARFSAAEFGGDVVGANQIPVPRKVQWGQWI